VSQLDVQKQKEFTPVPTSSYQFPPVPTSSHQFLPVPTSSHQFPPVPTSSHQFSPVPTSSYQFPPVSTSSHQFLPVPTSSHQFLPVPTSSYQFLPVPTCSHQFLPVPTRFKQLKIRENCLCLWMEGKMYFGSIFVFLCHNDCILYNVAHVAGNWRMCFIATLLCLWILMTFKEQKLKYSTIACGCTLGHPML
jgi:hypothetical protein